MLVNCGTDNEMNTKFSSNIWAARVYYWRPRVGKFWDVRVWCVAVWWPAAVVVCMGDSVNWPLCREREQASNYVRGLCAGCAVVEAPPQRMNWMVVTDACCRVRRGMHLCVTERVLALTYCVMFLLLVAYWQAILECHSYGQVPDSRMVRTCSGGCGRKLCAVVSRVYHRRV